MASTGTTCGPSGQFCRGKSFDTFCPLGPHVVPVEAIDDPQALTVTCRLNGDIMLAVESH
ncbi:MAG: fumarylacetoacetate hydrolase family protein, partial [Planctomycetota bacterium]